MATDQRISYEVPKYDRHDLERLFFQMDSILHSRVSNLLLAETIFFLAAAAVWSNAFLLATISILGLITTVLFGFTNLKLYYRIIWCITQLKRLDPNYAAYLGLCGMSVADWPPLDRWMIWLIRNNAQPKWMDSGWLYAWGLSILYSAGWGVLFGFAVLEGLGFIGPAALK